MRRTRRWFIKPHDDHTISVVRDLIGEDRRYDLIRMEHGKLERGVFECTLDERDLLQASRSSKPLNFTVLTGFENGPFKVWNPHEEKHKTIKAVKLFGEAIRRRSKKAI